MKRLAIVTTHPIQYYAPIFRLLTERGKVFPKVFYTWQQGAERHDEGFGKAVQWDIPLLDGYAYEFVSNNGNLKRGFWDVKNPTLLSAINDFKPDAVLIIGWNYFSHLKAIRYFNKKVPIIFRGDSTLLDLKKGNLKNILKKIFLRWVYSHVDFGLYVGTNNKAYYKKYGLKEKQLFFAPHAIDNGRFQQTDATELSACFEKLKIEKKIKIILFVGKFQSKKDPMILVDTVKKLKRKDIVLLMVGNGEMEEALKEKADDSPQIQFLPFQNQTALPALYKASDIFCLPSRGPEETWGLVVNEAMACGKALLVSDKVGCAVDLVKNGYNGYVFTAGDQGDLATKIEAIIDSGKIEEMGVHSRSIISDWSFEHIAASLENLCALTERITHFR